MIFALFCTEVRINVNNNIYHIIQLFELIMIRDGVYKQFSVIDDGNVLNINEVKPIIYFICTT